MKKRRYGKCNDSETRVPIYKSVAGRRKSTNPHGLEVVWPTIRPDNCELLVAKHESDQ